MKSLIVLISFFLSVSIFAENISVNNPYVRLLPPTSPTTGAFMDIINDSDKSVKLVKAESNCCNLVELHTHTMVDGMMRMREVKSIEIPAKGKISLKPGGLHIMLIGLKKPLRLGENIPIKLTFDNSETKEVQAKIQKITPAEMKY